MVSITGDVCFLCFSFRQSADATFVSDLNCASRSVLHGVGGLSREDVAPREIMLTSRDDRVSYPVCVYPLRTRWNGSGSCDPGRQLSYCVFTFGAVPHV